METGIVLGLGILVALFTRQFVAGRDIEASLGVFGWAIVGSAAGYISARVGMKLSPDAYFVFFSSASMSAAFVGVYALLFRRNPAPIKVQRVLDLPRVPAPIVRMRRPSERDVVFLRGGNPVQAAPTAAESVTVAARRMLLSIERSH